MTTYTGKIGRQCREIRHELGERIEDGQPGKEIVAWLNGLPPVQAVLQAQFKGQAISEQNLSDWKQAGHQDWLRREAIRERLERTRLDVEELAEERKCDLGGLLATVLLLEMDALLTPLLEPERDLGKRWQRLREMHREVSRLRQDDHRATRMALCEQKSKVQSRPSNVGDTVAKAAREAESNEPKTPGLESEAEGCEDEDEKEDLIAEQEDVGASQGAEETQHFAEVKPPEGQGNLRNPA